MLSCKVEHLRTENRIDEFRRWQALVPHLMQGLLTPNAAELPPASVDQFLQSFSFERANEGGTTGFYPLTAAAASGNVRVARELIDVHKVDVNMATTAFHTTIGIDEGGTPLHFATAACPPEHMEEMVAVLLGAGADPNRGSKSGATPLIWAVMYQNLVGVKALIKHAKDRLNLEIRVAVNNSPALGFAVFVSTPEILISANIGKVDVNRVQRPLTFKWRLIFALAKTVYKHNLAGKSDLIMGLAHSRGSTALHQAALSGHASIAESLLKNGAHESLTVRNQMGCTPIDVARIFGPHPEVEARLGAALLEQMGPAAPADVAAVSGRSQATRPKEQKVKLRDLEC
jgi:hypothetical protein